MNIEYLKSVLDFQSEDEVYVLAGIARKKNNPKIKNQAAVFRDIIKNTETFERKIKKMLALIRNYEHEEIKPEDFNLYITFNPRSCRKAYKMLKTRFAEWDFSGVVLPHLKKLQGEWNSCLRKLHSKARPNYFMIDIDCQDPDLLNEMLSFARRVSPDFSRVFKTRHGWHILLKPFDVREFASVGLAHSEVELFKDGNLNLHEIVYLG